MSVEIFSIVAMTPQRVIGSMNGIPWRLPKDQRRFAELTTGHTVLMGRKTYDSLPKKFCPLPNRKNIVVTRNSEYPVAEGVVVISDVVDYLEKVKSGTISLPTNQLWIIGGEEIYRLTMSFVDQIYLTLVDQEVEGDAFFPRFEGDFKENERQAEDGFSFVNYVRS